MIARALSNLLKADVKFEFGAQQKEAFDRLKFMLSVKPILKLYKQKAETELHTDASSYGYGAILFQKCEKDDVLHPIYYARKDDRCRSKVYQLRAGNLSDN